MLQAKEIVVYIENNHHHLGFTTMDNVTNELRCTPGDCDFNLYQPSCLKALLLLLLFVVVVV